MTIAVIDYGMGNLHSVAKALEHVTHEHVVVTRDARRIQGATRLVLPGHVVPALAARALPVRLGDAALRALGVQSSMRGFTGRR